MGGWMDGDRRMDGGVEGGWDGEWGEGGGEGGRERKMAERYLTKDVLYIYIMCM